MRISRGATQETVWSNLLARRWSTVSAALVLLGFSAALTNLAFRNSPTYDEPLHFAAGVKAFFGGDTSVDSLHPPTIRAIGVGLAALLGLRPPINLPGAKNGDVVMLGSSLVSALGNDWLLPLRFAVIVMVIVTMSMLFLALRSLFGEKSALATIVLWATCPTLLAHAHLFTTDAVPASLVVLAFALHLGATRRESPPILAWLTLGLAIAGKATLLPFTVIMWTLTVWGCRRHRRRSKNALVILGPLLALAVLWVPYIVLRFGLPFGSPATTGSSRLGKLLSVLPILPSDLSTGLIGRISLNQPTSYFLGESYSGGRWYYFPVAIAIKTQVSTLVAAVAASYSIFRMRTPGVLSHFLVPGLAYLVVLAMGDFNIGIRHALVVILFALTAIGASLTRAKTRIRHLITLLIILGALETIMQFPQTISFSNVAAGSYPNTHKYLSDSNVDWGQDAERAVRVARAAAPGIPAFAYFGTAPPPDAESVSLDAAIGLVESSERAVLISYSLLHNAREHPIRSPDRVIGGSVALWLPKSD